MSQPAPAGKTLTVLIGQDPVKLPEQKNVVWKAYFTADQRWELSTDGTEWFPVDAYEQFDVACSSIGKWQFRANKDVELKVLLLGNEV